MSGKFHDDRPRIKRYLQIRECFHIGAQVIVFMVTVLLFDTFF